jgi:hypothetical protein
MDSGDDPFALIDRIFDAFIQGATGQIHSTPMSSDRAGRPVAPLKPQSLRDQLLGDEPDDNDDAPVQSTNSAGHSHSYFSSQSSSSTYRSLPDGVRLAFHFTFIL